VILASKTIKMAEFKYKTNLKKRFWASFIDYFLGFLVTILYIEHFGTEEAEGKIHLSGIAGLPIEIFWFCYFVVIETYCGATLGHQAFNLLVLTENRKAIGFKESLKRHLVDPVDFFIYALPAFITIKNTEKHQRLGDLWAKTIVVDTTDPEQFNPKID
jgi:uncharacterized RDD family membrane protein YckC